MPKIPYNLLSNALRQDTIEIPVGVGVVCVKIQQIDGSLFSDLWAALQVAENANTEANQGDDLVRRRATKSAMQEAWSAVLDPCVVEMGDTKALDDAAPVYAVTLESQKLREAFTVTLLRVIDLYQYGIIAKPPKVGEAAPLATPPETTT
jgi:hypothetical protein